MLVETPPSAIVRFHLDGYKEVGRHDTQACPAYPVALHFHSHPTSFTPYKPSPLKIIETGERYVLETHFSGSVQLSGRFSVEWTDLDYLHVLFFPDQPSAALLPYERERGPVKALYLSNSQQAVALLLDTVTAQRVLAKKLRAVHGAVT